MRLGRQSIQLTVNERLRSGVHAWSNYRRNGRANVFDLSKEEGDVDKVPWLGVVGTARRSTSSLDI
jgi:hypothetical protein